MQEHGELLEGDGAELRVLLDQELLDGGLGAYCDHGPAPGQPDEVDLEPGPAQEQVQQHRRQRERHPRGEVQRSLAPEQSAHLVISVK